MQSDFSWLVPIEVMLGSLNHGEVQACSISSVPDELRDPKVSAYNYKPKVISIGPLHRGSTRQLQLMEEPKWHYMHEFLNRQGTEDQNRRSELRLRDCGNDILKLDKVVRASYGGNIELEAHEIAKIMIVDGCFLLELLIKHVDYMEGNQTQTTTGAGGSNINFEDPIFKNKEKVLCVMNDITMLENQIPFIVLKKLYRKVFPIGIDLTNDHRVANIVRKAFGYPLLDTSGGAHILHLMHLSTVDQQGEQEGKRAKQELFRCATKLRAAGISIRAKPNDPSQSQNQSTNHKFVDVFNFDVSFSELGKLEIPTLYVKETTEVKWRNLIAWEQSRIWIRCKYTSYALFFNALICCKHDIEFLMEKGVIVNESKKSKEDLLAMFKTISKGVEHMDSSYSEICERLNVYKGKKVTKVLRGLGTISWHECRRDVEILVYYWRNWYRMLIRDHIPTVWKFIGVMAATLLIVLTIMQTYYSSRGKG